MGLGMIPRSRRLLSPEATGDLLERQTLCFVRRLLLVCAAFLVSCSAHNFQVAQTPAPSPVVPVSPDKLYGDTSIQGSGSATGMGYALSNVNISSNTLNATVASSAHFKLQGGVNAN
jgi:hypothetical protein